MIDRTLTQKYFPAFLYLRFWAYCQIQVNNKLRRHKNDCKRDSRCCKKDGAECQQDEKSGTGQNDPEN